jgi:hypothetical protein
MDTDTQIKAPRKPPELDMAARLARAMRLVARCYIRRGARGTVRWVTVPSQSDPELTHTVMAYGRPVSDWVFWRCDCTWAQTNRPGDRGELACTHLVAAMLATRAAQGAAHTHIPAHAHGRPQAPTDGQGA